MAIFSPKRTFLPYIVLCGGGWGRIFFQKYSNIPLEAIPYRIAALYDILGKKLLKKNKWPKTLPMKYHILPGTFARATPKINTPYRLEPPFYCY